jgi:hypothetical protein
MSIELDQLLLQEMESDDHLDALVDNNDILDLMYDDEAEDPFETIFTKDIDDYDESLEEVAYEKGIGEAVEDEMLYSPTELEIIDMAAEEEEEAIDDVMTPDDYYQDDAIDMISDEDELNPEQNDIYYQNDDYDGECC